MLKVPLVATVPMVPMAPMAPMVAPMGQMVPMVPKGAMITMAPTALTAPVGPVAPKVAPKVVPYVVPMTPIVPVAQGRNREVTVRPGPENMNNSDCVADVPRLLLKKARDPRLLVHKAEPASVRETLVKPWSGTASTACACAWPCSALAGESACPRNLRNAFKRVHWAHRSAASPWRSAVPLRRLHLRLVWASF